jgi:hypothetical protein
MPQSSQGLHNFFFPVCMCTCKMPDFDLSGALWTGGCMSAAHLVSRVLSFPLVKYLWSQRCRACTIRHAIFGVLCVQSSCVPWMHYKKKNQVRISFGGCIGQIIRCYSIAHLCNPFLLYCRNLVCRETNSGM